MGDLQDRAYESRDAQNLVAAIATILLDAGWRDSADAQWKGLESALPLLSVELAAAEISKSDAAHEIESLQAQLAPLRAYFRGTEPLHEQVADELNRLQAACHEKDNELATQSKAYGLLHVENQQLREQLAWDNRPIDAGTIADILYAAAPSWPVRVRSKLSNEAMRYFAQAVSEGIAKRTTHAPPGNGE